MLFNEESYRNELETVFNSLKQDMKEIRTGRPSLEFFETVYAEYYGSKTPITYMAQISFDGPLTVSVKVHDKNSSPNVKRAIEEANIGASVVEPEKGLLKLNFQPPTQEARLQKVKDLNKLLEDKRVRARQVRQKYMEEVKSLEKVPEDEQKRSEEKIQDILDSHIEKLEELAKTKEQELMAI